MVPFCIQERKYVAIVLHTPFVPFRFNLEMIKEWPAKYIWLMPGRPDYAMTVTQYIREAVIFAFD